MREKSRALGLVPTLDSIDRQILETLQKNARISNVQLAREVGRSETTIRERVENLEREGVISGYHAQLNQVRLGYGATAMVQANFDMNRLDELVPKLRSIPNVTRMVVATGSRPVHLEITTGDLMELERIIEKRLAPLNLLNLAPTVIIKNLIEHRYVPMRLIAAGPDADAERLAYETASVVLAR